ncbi:hypothetical protein Rhe02_70670 [Rhizocola hellebori]|uniref:Uncharacterized protein n=2 Tax=Rhizocola hellebori TaxID=1392758 RepID=A0A8J3QDX2_9ACTN|nr:hypothetical protein Rhe02_70670 [Rhizocola hellebori]
MVEHLTDYRLVSEVEPELAGLLIKGLRAAGEGELADQVSQLRYHGRCECDSDSCRSFYTAPRTDGAYGPGHRNITLDVGDTHMVVVDVVEADIVFAEFI